MRSISVKQAGKDDNVCELTEGPLTPKGAIMCHPHMDAYILSIIGLEKQVDVPSVKQALQSSLVNHRPFCSSIKKGRWGNYLWVHKEVIDIEKHVIVPALDPQYIQCKEFVEDYTASLACDPPLDPSSPLWQIHILNYRSGEAEASLVFKIHHCLDLVNLIATILWMKDSKIFRRGRSICPKRLAHVTIDLQDIAVVKNALNCTVNDVVVGMLSAGFVQYIKHPHAEALWKGSNVDKVISKLRLRALVAVNMRPLPGLHRLEYMLSNPKQARWGNEFGTWLLPIPLEKQEDPLNYCRITTANLLKKKASMEASLMFFLLGLVSRFSLVKLAMYLLYRVTLNTTMVFSNVLGPVEDVQFMGNRVTHIITTVSWLPQPIVIHFQSYARKAKLVVMAAEDTMPDPLQLCMYCLDALKQMKEAALRREIQ
ncbi:wax ester synthase/diacylglycerol acyltransferase 5 isoform X3 [Cryptomeria japonica]|uniref:wax ester synthase/diacylglycerol acyltransferase 5 isoform X3 n=1 Tax=Cryptomeria japonica TaxID=3369 RepID=UPI0027DA9728|nr:wax ester synthase/diacylglycerol acyltransferase 5 isoform X3 [Cryptomeria japonica]